MANSPFPVKCVAWPARDTLRLHCPASSVGRAGDAGGGARAGGGLVAAHAPARRAPHAGRAQPLEPALQEHRQGPQPDIHARHHQRAIEHVAGMILYCYI